MCMLFSFSGCTFISGIDSYLKPPKLSEEHEQIYNALINTEGSKINLKYPKSGNYLSAFVVANIDDEPTEEAMVFYEKSGFSGSDAYTLRMNILDQKDGQWQSVYDFATDANEIERVFISKLGKSDITSVIIGVSSQSEKTARLFCYDGATTQPPQILGNYSYMDIRDMNNNSQNELIILSSTPTGNTAQLKWLDSDGTLISSPETLLSEIPADIAQLSYSKSTDNKSTLIFVDSFLNTNTITTDILYTETKDNIIYLKKSEIENIDDELIKRTVRNSSLISRDIDNDGVVEIPINNIFIGYEDKPETEQIPMTEWYVLEEGMLIKKYSGYYSINDGYAFLMPSEWMEKVTVRFSNEDLIFCKYDEIVENQTELLKICVTSSEEANSIIKEKNYEKYEQMYSNGDTVYLICLPDHNIDPLIPSESRVQFNFKVII